MANTPASIRCDHIMHPSQLFSVLCFTLLSNFLFFAGSSLRSCDLYLERCCSGTLCKDHSLQIRAATLLALESTPIRKRDAVEIWGDGWTVITQTGPWFMPFETSAAYLQRFFETTMAAVAAAMLQGRRLHGYFRMAHRPVIFEIVPLAGQVTLDWTTVFLMTQFMHNRAVRGYTGTGQVVFRHASGLAIQLTISLAEGYGTVIPKPCGHSC